MDQHRLRIGISATVVHRRTGQFCNAGPAFAKSALEENVAVIGRRIANPHENAAGLNLTTIKECGTTAENRIAVANDQTVGDVDGPVHLQRITRTENADVAQDISISHQQQPFSLAARRRLDGEIYQMNIGGVVAHECRTPRREGSRPLVGTDVRGMRIENLVIRIGDDHLVAILAEQRHVRLIAKVDDLFVVAVSDKDRHGSRAPVRHKINRSLHGVEIAASVRCHHNPLGSAGQPCRLCRKGPAGIARDSFETAIGDAQHAGIDLNVVGLVVLKEIVVGVDRRNVVVDDDRIEVKPVGEPADYPAGKRDWPVTLPASSRKHPAGNAEVRMFVFWSPPYSGPPSACGESLAG